MVTKNVSKLSIKGTRTTAVYGFQKRYQCVNMAGEITGRSGHSNSVSLKDILAAGIKNKIQN